jgi:ankyrin repeat protein
MEKNVIIKKLILTFVVGFLSLASFAQDANDYLVRGAKIYIESNNENVIEHSIDKIALWGYWKTVNSKEQADFILNLDANFSIFYTINAQAITKDNKIIKRFKSKNSFKSLDVNPKRGAVKALFEKEIIPFVHGLY